MHRIYKLTLTMNNLKQLICIIAATFVLWGSFTVSLKADHNTPMGIMTDVKQVLRKAYALKIVYSANKPRE